MKKLENFQKAVTKLQEFLRSSPDTELEQTGVIQAFEYSFEAAWKYLQAIGTDAGYECNSPKTSLAAGLQMGLIPHSKESVWASMLSDRNLTSHTYQATLLATMFQKIRDEYTPELARLSRPTP